LRDARDPPESWSWHPIPDGRPHLDPPPPLAYHYFPHRETDEYGQSSSPTQYAATGGGCFPLQTRSNWKREGIRNFVCSFCSVNCNSNYGASQNTQGQWTACVAMSVGSVHTPKLQTVQGPKGVSPRNITFLDKSPDVQRQTLQYSSPNACSNPHCPSSVTKPLGPIAHVNDPINFLPPHSSSWRERVDVHHSKSSTRGVPDHAKTSEAGESRNYFHQSGSCCFDCHQPISKFHTGRALCPQMN